MTEVLIFINGYSETRKVSSDVSGNIVLNTDNLYRNRSRKQTERARLLEQIIAIPINISLPLAYQLQKCHKLKDGVPAELRVQVSGQRGTSEELMISRNTERP